MEMTERVWGETEEMALRGSVDVVNETSCRLPADGIVLADPVRRCRSDSSNFG